MWDLARVSQLALSFLVHLQEDKVVLGWTVWALESDGTDLNPASIALCDLPQPQLCPVRNEGNTTSLIGCCKDELAWWRSETRACLTLGWCSINVSYNRKRNVSIRSWEIWESHCPRFQARLCLLLLDACREGIQSLNFIFILWKLETIMLTVLASYCYRDKGLRRQQLKEHRPLILHFQRLEIWHKAQRAKIEVSEASRGCPHSLACSPLTPSLKPATEGLLSHCITLAYSSVSLFHF